MHLQELVPEPTVEGFDESVLPGRARRDVEGIHAQVDQPLLNLPGDEFTAIVRTNVARCAPFADELAEHV